MKTKLDRIKRDIEALGQFNSTPGFGLTRFSLTEADRGAREYLRSELRALGLQVYEDAAGSIFGRQKGENDVLPVIMIGSHFDSVKNGGNFDGPAGVVMALEIMRVLHENSIKTKYPIEFVAMIEEEGGRFGGGVFGSRAMTGLVDYEQLKRSKDENGVSMAEAFEAFGFDPSKIKEAARSPQSIKAFIELHIEQGPILESKGLDIGVVDFIVGINQIKVSIKGRPDHAGTTPMNMRADALNAAARVISRISKYALEEGNGTVATVGTLKISPGAANIVPGLATFTVDIRSRNSASIDAIRSKIQEDLKLTTEETDTSFEITDMLYVKPVKMAPRIIELFEKGAREHQFTYTTMSSGAGHDAMIMGAVTDVGLIFVPSKGGRSHCPEEWTDYEDLQKGIELIYSTILELGEVIK